MINLDTIPDYLTNHAESKKLARRIEEYWRRRGYPVIAKVTSQKIRGNDEIIYVVESNVEATWQDRISPTLKPSKKIISEEAAYD